MHKLTYTIREAAEVTGLSRGALYAALNHRELSAVKFGTRTLIRHDDLVDFVNSMLQPWTPGTRSGERRQREKRLIGETA